MRTRIIVSIAARCGFLLATFSVMNVFGVTTWTGTYTGVTSVTVPYSTHGIASGYLTVMAAVSDGTLDPFVDFSSSVDQTSYAVSVTFAQTFTGTVSISGPWPSSDTGTGWTPTIFSDTRVFGINGACTDSPCRITIGASTG